MKNTSKFQNVVIATIVGWLVLFVFLPNLMIIATSFLTRDDAHFVSQVFTLENYARLLDPLYFQVLLHSLNMALIATLACLVLGYPFAWFLAKLPQKVRPLLLFLLIVPFWTNSLIRIYGLKIFLSTKGYLNAFLLWLGGDRHPDPHYVYPRSGDYWAGLYPAAVYGDAALLQYREAG
ncbi:Spermidine/putrescine transport system permease protein PotB [Leclercia adecarboxylata]|uniref:Spermidine/putrescine transport system permease protein PotB n=1 Tax=Leclercia adecarboxylata TaxID=83655 RepID=A0A4U9HQM8_9ENTR|nr:Spermidine/putrescine transport system permease protein PotB [Leclercia adecarboxylata]